MEKYAERGTWLVDKKAGCTFKVMNRKGEPQPDGSVAKVVYICKDELHHSHSDCRPLTDDDEASMVALLQLTAREAARAGCMASLDELSAFRKSMPESVVKAAWMALPLEVKAAITQLGKQKAVAC